jgi:hypothetical protein
LISSKAGLGKIPPFSNAYQENTGKYKNKKARFFLGNGPLIFDYSQAKNPCPTGW